ncbi:hypothetical protein ACFVVX_11400 [Kitasatospora sp. NPDC058170]|uniref:hypothetical protein n=1 Tax=Kitasatospora sp. NPDC058170 TaxID=3346364 RepID=UPI0036DF3792
MQHGRVVAWVGAGVSCAVALGLGAVAIWVDLDTADRTASVIGAVGGVVGLAIAAYALARPAGGGSSVKASGRNSVAVGGSIQRVVTGNNNRFTSPPAPAPAAPAGPAAAPVAGSVEASGEGAIAAGGSITEAVTGDGNTL